MPAPKIKICCISSREEARMAIDAGAWALGLVAEMPSGPGPIADELIAEIASVYQALASLEKGRQTLDFNIADLGKSTLDVGGFGFGQA